jgi:hypothetical protein
MKTLDWSVETLGLDYNSTGLCNHLFKTCITVQLFRARLALKLRTIGQSLEGGFRRGVRKFIAKILMAFLNCAEFVSAFILSDPNSKVSNILSVDSLTDILRPGWPSLRTGSQAELRTCIDD